MSIQLFTPLVRKQHIERRLSDIDLALSRGKLFYVRGDSSDKIRERIKELEAAEGEFFSIFGITGNQPVREKAEQLQKLLDSCSVTLTSLNGPRIEQEILSACTGGYYESMLDYLRTHIITEGMVEQEMTKLGKDATWNKAFIKLLNKLTKSTDSSGRKGRLHSNTKGLTSAKSFKELTEDQLTFHAKSAIAQIVINWIEQNSKNKKGGKTDISAVVQVYQEHQIKVTPKAMDWRAIILGLTPTAAKSLENNPDLNFKQNILAPINERVTELIIQFSGLTNEEDRKALRWVIENKVLATNEYAFLVGKNNKQITGLLGEIQGLYYVHRLMQKIGGNFDESRLQWLADTRNAKGEKLSVDLLVDNLGIQVKNTTRDLTDDFARSVDFTTYRLTLRTLATQMGIEDEHLIDSIVSLFQTRMFNIEYQTQVMNDGKEKYTEGANEDFAPTRERMEWLVHRVEGMLSLWMEFAMHLGLNASAESALVDNNNVIYLVGGVFFGASEILSKLFTQLDDAGAFRIEASSPNTDINIVTYLQGKKKRTTMYGDNARDVKIKTHFNFQSLL